MMPQNRSLRFLLMELRRLLTITLILLLYQSKQAGGIGFRDLESFNMAVTAKQLWKIFDKPSSLIERMFKAR